MGQSKRQVADERAHTDASLDAERVTSDVDSAGYAAVARRLLDDLIDRDRLLADLGLLKFRAGADSTLSRDRSSSPAPDASVAREQTSADQRMQVEREVTDALLLRERQRSDLAVQADRSEHDAIQSGLEERRQCTDEQLSIERQGADSTTATLGKTTSVLGEAESALADARTKGGRQTDVLGIVTHDLRSPLAVISLSAGSIAEMTNEPATRSAAHAIGLAAARMERLLSDLLDIARIDSGTLRIIRQRQDLGALLAEVRRSYEPMFAARGITFKVGTLETKLHASFDHDRIVQVLSNLLGNAMKFTQAGGTVALDVEQRTDALIFTVRDDGPGVPQAALLHVFDRFWQIDSHTRRGLGLGLHICQNLIQAHGGRIWAESELGKGATFGFTLPTT
ncbi:MAG: ATP-binding protein [Gammaproteobacteria bacterium]